MGEIWAAKVGGCKGPAKASRAARVDGACEWAQWGHLETVHAGREVKLLPTTRQIRFGARFVAPQLAGRVRAAGLDSVDLDQEPNRLVGVPKVRLLLVLRYARVVALLLAVIEQELHLLLVLRGIGRSNGARQSERTRRFQGVPGDAKRTT